MLVNPWHCHPRGETEVGAAGTPVGGGRDWPWPSPLKSAQRGSGHPVVGSTLLLLSLINHIVIDAPLTLQGQASVSGPQATQRLGDSLSHAAAHPTRNGVSFPPHLTQGLSLSGDPALAGPPARGSKGRSGSPRLVFWSLLPPQGRAPRVGGGCQGRGRSRVSTSGVQGVTEPSRAPDSGHRVPSPRGSPPPPSSLSLWPPTQAADAERCLARPRGWEQRREVRGPVRCAASPGATHVRHVLLSTPPPRPRPLHTPRCVRGCAGRLRGPVQAARALPQAVQRTGAAARASIPSCSRPHVLG